MATPMPYPTTFPGDEISLCIEHAVSGAGDEEEVKHAAWVAVGFFFGHSVPAPVAPDPAAPVVDDAAKTAYAASIKGHHSKAKTLAAVGSIPPWLLPLILQILNGLLTKP